jgi:hypothetical protein
MSNRRAQDERIEGTPDGSNAITEIVDIPDTPIIGTATAGIAGASVPFTAATTGGTASTFTATSTPGSINSTSATSPITVSGLTAGTAYTFTVTPSNSTGTGPASSSSNSITPVDLISAYDNLATVTLSATAASITFIGIPTGYDHLQIRGIGRTNRATPADMDGLLIQFNGDTAASYSDHALRGDGASATASSDVSYTGMEMYRLANLYVASTLMGAQIVDILDYANTNKYKTVRGLGGVDNNGSGMVALNSGNWRNTSAITSILLKPASGTLFTAYTSFALYGVK